MPAIALQMHTVLVVEDDDDIRDMICELLEHEGYKVEQARNGAEALNHLRRQDREPCIVLLDLMMPVIDGWQVLEVLRQDDRLMTIPVAVISASAVAKPLPPGVRVFKKPVVLKALVEAVREACDHPASWA